MAHQSFAKTVLETALLLASQNNGQVNTDALSIELRLKNSREHKKLISALGDLQFSGRLRRISQGVYGPPVQKRLPNKREIMWRLLQMRRRVSVEDLMELAGVSREYAKQWLRVLVKREVVRKEQQPGKAGVWHLINPSADMPEDEDSAAKLRNLRLQHKAAVHLIDTTIKQLQSASEALFQAKAAITSMEEV
ncbi:MAG: hypothetical protein PHI97_00895 [Desulfobulbus sp.]|nr:hypothetical protein [Desulfobulbus sp.]